MFTITAYKNLDQTSERIAKVDTWAEVQDLLDSTIDHAMHHDGSRYDFYINKAGESRYFRLMAWQDEEGAFLTEMFMS